MYNQNLINNSAHTKDPKIEQSIPGEKQLNNNSHRLKKQIEYPSVSFTM